MINLYSIGHLFIHKGPNWLKHVFVLIGMSAREQVIMHCLSHHPYPNTLIDYEFAALEPVVNFSRCLPKNSTLSYIGMQVLFLIVVLANIVTKCLIVPLITRKVPQFVQALALLQPLFIYLITGDPSFSIKLFLLMISVYGFVFGQTVICPHRQGFLWSEGAEEIRDYVLHTVATTSDMDHEVGGLQSLIRFVGFNIHVAHHLFPTIDHNKLKGVNGIVLQFCREKGIKIAVNSQFECDKKLYKFVNQK